MNRTLLVFVSLPQNDSETRPRFTGRFEETDGYFSRGEQTDI